MSAQGVDELVISAYYYYLLLYIQNFPSPRDTILPPVTSGVQTKSEHYAESVEKREHYAGSVDENRTLKGVSVDEKTGHYTEYRRRRKKDITRSVAENRTLHGM